MNESLPGYGIIEMVHEGPRTIILRATEQECGDTVILKTLREPHPDLRDVSRFHRQAEIAAKARLRKVLAPRRLIRHGQRMWLVMKDFRGVQSQKVFDDRVNIGQFLDVAIQTTEALCELHDQRIIHHDIKPSNILVHPESGEVRLVDLGLASRFSEESQEITHPKMIEGTLAHLAPEKTGRTGRPVDYRADFYSLGTTFYRWLTGKLPFECTDVVELIHSHIARLPENPSDLKSEIPAMLSRIVFRLMEKDAERRYQTCRGLQHDLEICRNHWNAAREIPQFDLGSQDFSDRFVIPKKLYGREEHTKELLASLEKARLGCRCLNLIYGPAGTGKSALINEIQQPLARGQGLLMAGKFDQVQRDIPYASILQAFQGLIRQILSESQSEIECWREKILSAVGDNAQVIIDVVPEMELILGPQPALESVLPVEAQNRFRDSFCKVITVLAQADQPLVLLLDDLQWSDRASLNLLKEILLTEDMGYLMVIATFRENELDAKHPWREVWEELRKHKLELVELPLTGLDKQDSHQLVADALGCAGDECEELSSILHQKTNGNPFFLNRLLDNLHRERLITRAGRFWSWDLDGINGHQIPGDVVALVLAEIKELPSRVRERLTIAACIGNQFDLKTLATVCGVERLKVAQDLDIAIAHNLISSRFNSHQLITYLALEESESSPELNAYYRFQHDRIQQAAYTLLDGEDQKCRIHLKIGRLLLRNTADSQEAHLFDLVNHLNYGVSLIHSHEEKLTLARLNLKAGKRAKSAVAYETACRYLEQGISLLPNNGWQHHYELAFGLHREKLECEYLSGNFSAAEDLVRLLLAKARDSVEAAEIYGLQVVLFTTRGEHASALAAAHEGLTRLGWKPPRQGRRVRWAVRREILKIRLMLVGKRIPDLLDEKPIQDRKELAKLNLMAQVIPVLYFTDMESSNLFYLRMASLCLRHGTAPMASVAYLGLGRFLGERLGMSRERYEFGKLAVQIVEASRSKALKCKTYFLFGGFIHHWSRPGGDDLTYLRAAHESGVASGDIVWACYANNVLCMRMLLLGMNLVALEEEAHRSIEKAKRCQEQWTPPFLRVTLQVARCLQGKTESLSSLTDEDYDEKSHIEVLQSQPELIGALNWYFVTKCFLCLLAGEKKIALEMAEKADETIISALGLYRVADHCFYLALSLAANDGHCPDHQKRKARRKRLYECCDQLSKYAQDCPENFQHKHDLVRAEIARIEGNDELAQKHYIQAINGAQRNNYLQNLAIAYESTAEFYGQRGQHVNAKAYRVEAYHSYLQWGAAGKAASLMDQESWKRVTTAQDSFPSVNQDAGEIDYLSLVTAAQSLSSEIKIDKLLVNMVKTLLMNSGAQRVALILQEQEDAVIQAEGFTETTQIRILHQRSVESACDLSKHIVNYVLRTGEAIALSEGEEHKGFLHDPYLINAQPKSLLCTPIKTKGKILGAVYLENNLAANSFNPERLEAIRILSTQLAISIENSTLVSDLKELNTAYKRFIPHEFLSFLDRKTIREVQLGDQVLKHMTVMFADIRNFTGISEKLTASENFQFLNEYLKRTGPVIRRNNGFIDKYIGDAIMALFPSTAADAVSATLELEQELATFNEELSKRGLDPIRVGVGIHTGTLMLGTIGEEQRIESTVISDTVNIANRVEDLTKLYCNKAIITEEVLAECGSDQKDCVRSLGKVTIRGKQEPIGIYDLFCMDRTLEKELKSRTRAEFELGVSLLEQGELEDAERQFREVLAANPSDQCAASLLQLCGQRVQQQHFLEVEVGARDVQQQRAKG